MEVYVSSPNVKYTDDYIEAIYDYQSTKVEKRGSKYLVRIFTIFLFTLFVVISLIKYK